MILPLHVGLVNCEYDLPDSLQVRLGPAFARQTLSHSHLLIAIVAEQRVQSTYHNHSVRTLVSFIHLIVCALGSSATHLLVPFRLMKLRIEIHLFLPLKPWACSLRAVSSKGYAFAWLVQV